MGTDVVDEHFLQACREGREDVVRQMLAKGVDPNTYGAWSLLKATMGGHRGVVAALLDAGAHPCANHCEALLASIQYHRVDLTSLLLAAGADATAGGLWQAAHSNNVAAVAVLIEYGADPKANDSEALAIASSERCAEVFAVLYPLCEPHKALSLLTGDDAENKKMMLVQRMAEEQRAVLQDVAQHKGPFSGVRGARRL